MPNYAGIQKRIDHGLGIAARKLGWPHAAYRLEASSAGDFPTGWTTIASNVLVHREKATDRYLESNLQAAGSLWYELMFDASSYLLNDVFLQTDPTYSSGHSYGPGATVVDDPTLQLNGFSLAWHRPVMRPIGARIDRRIQIFRPDAAPQLMFDGTPRWSMTANDALPLVLSGGSYSFGKLGATASYVPAGFGSTDRPPRGQNFPPATPGVTQVVRWYAYLPYLPGYEPSEGDMLRMEDGSRYIVINPWSQETGVVGSQLFLERLVSQDL